VAPSAVIDNFTLYSRGFLGFILGFSFSPPYFVEEIRPCGNFFFYLGFLPCYCEIGNLVRERKKEKRKQGGFCTSSLFFWCSLASKYTLSCLQYASWSRRIPRRDTEAWILRADGDRACCLGRRILRVLGCGGIERRNLFLVALLVLCACEAEPCRRRPKRRTAVACRRGRCSSTSPAPARSSTPTTASPSTGNPPFRRSTSSPRPAMPPRRRRPPAPPPVLSLSSASADARASMAPRTAPSRWLSCPRPSQLLPQLMLAPTLARHPCFLPASLRARRVGVWWVPEHLRRRRRRFLCQMLHRPRRGAGR
jgi:hypothetical protein